MKKAALVIAVMAALMMTEMVYATEIGSVISQLDMDSVERSHSGFRALVEKAVAGELDLSPQSILREGLLLLAGELVTQLALLRNLFVVAILAALLKNLTDSFKNKGVAKLGFYVSYIVLVTVLFNSFQIAVSTMQELIVDLTGIMEASLPLMVSLIAITGKIGGAYAFHPLVLFVINVAASLIKNVVAPVVVLGAGVQIVNYLTEQELLSKFAELIRQGTSLAIKGITLVFVAAMSLQRASSGIADNLATRTARSAAGAIPVVGDILTGAVDTVNNFAMATKSGVSVAIIIVLVMTVALPLMKILVLVLVYRFTAAAIQPVSDARIVKCIDSMAGFALLLLSAGVCVAVMFLFSIMIMLSF